MRLALLAALTALCACACAQPYRVGVVDVARMGGTGASSAGFIKVFDDLEGYEAEAVEALDPATLMRYDILIMYDVHDPGRVVEQWRDNVYAFARAGGSVLNIYHQHNFPTIGPGVLKVYVPEVRPVGDTPITAGLEPFKTAWSDHIILKPGADAVVFLENTEGQPVCACGPFGEGKAISCGLALGIRTDWRTSKPPAGVELRLLKNMLQWLQPVKRWPQRTADLAVGAQVSMWLRQAYARQPQPVVLVLRGAVPAETPAGKLTVTFTDAKGVRTERECDITPAPLEGANAAVANAVLEVSTEALASGPCDLHCVASIGNATHTKDFTVQLVRTEPPEKEFRAFWTHAFADRLPADIMPRIRACGFNAVIPRISGGAGAFYLSKVLPDVQNILGEEDWLANCIEQAHANGLQVHPYRNCFIMQGRASKETIAQFRAAGRLQVSPQGRPLDWMCPSQEINRQVEVAAASELVRDYEVDGFQFDFIRYPNADGCFCPKCREKFEKQLGRPVANWPQDVVKDGALFPEYTRFRQTQITETVKMVSEAIRKIKPQVKISAAVFRDYANDSISVGQDWVTWAKEGYVDFLCPMDYTDDVSKLDGWVREQVQRVGEDVPICAGLGLSSGASKFQTPEDLALQVDVARQAGATGFVLFAWYPGCDEKIVLPQRNDSLAGTPPIPWQ